MICDLQERLEKLGKWQRGEAGGSRDVFQGANLVDANLGDADLGHANLLGANLVGANLLGANLVGANLGDADLRYANLGDADLGHANLLGANLVGANLGHANLLGANLVCANLVDANLGDADLGDADLGHANLLGANLVGANLRGADLDYSCWPLWCGSLRAKADDRLVIQLLYHTLSLAQHSEISAELKDALNTPALIQQANRFHRVRECGRLEMWEEEDDENHG